MGITSQLHC